jgi:hypothetical protein
MINRGMEIEAGGTSQLTCTSSPRRLCPPRWRRAGGCTCCGWTAEGRKEEKTMQHMAYIYEHNQQSHTITAIAPQSCVISSTKQLTNHSLITHSLTNHSLTNHSLTNHSLTHALITHSLTHREERQSASTLAASRPARLCLKAITFLISSMH